MRHDIQFLRGIAVLSVLLYHARIGPLVNGYLGVDIFFVISGFLITTIILRGLSEDSFSFSEFYLRRAKRLLPALYSTLIFTTLLAYVFLTYRQWNDYLEQFLGAITFTSNLFLPLQVGYFEDAADTKPLLHIWSLSLEEQYYFFLPLLLFLTPQKLRGWVLAIVALLSLWLCLYFIYWAFTYWRFPNIDSAGWAFYLFPTRAWELLAGSLIAWYMLKAPTTSIPKSVKIASISGLMLLLCFSVDDAHPRGNAIIAVLLTCVVILGQDDWLPKDLITRSIERVGDWSYSLYLVHWPLLAFAQVSFLGKVPVYISAALGGMSIILAYLQYRYVEQHFRYGFQDSRKSAYRFFAVSTLILLLLPVPVALSSFGKRFAENENFEYLRRHNYGLGEHCNSTYQDQWPSACQTTENLTVAIWGDSYAMHLVPGLLANPNVKNSIIQVTKSACGPVLEIAVVDEKDNKNSAEKCIAHNNLALQYILSLDSVKYVVMSSPYSQYVKNEGQSLLFNGAVIAQNSEMVVSQMVKTIQLIRESGKTPIVFSPPPSSDFNIGDCLERKANHAVVFGRRDCNLTLEEYTRQNQPVTVALREVEKQTGARFIWLESLTCDDKVCQTRIEDVYLYRDGGHLSYAGSEFLLTNPDILQGR